MEWINVAQGKDQFGEYIGCESNGAPSLTELLLGLCSYQELFTDLLTPVTQQEACLFWYVKNALSVTTLRLTAKRL
jgi:hypothetical protein